MPVGYRKQPVKAVVSSPTRVLDTIYQNTTGRPLLIIVDVACVRGDVAAAAAYVTPLVENVTPPTVSMGELGLKLQNNVPENIEFHAVFMVPNENYYMVQKAEAGAGSAVTLYEWSEIEL